ncbi:potassium channel family protein [Alkalihalobacterium alkalinitrilicum]|uniref:potassium channel family protein n=1 Tax=Alkalihalobacterium alkalinitrilicum TaxID=427920 RepID=UPI001EE43724|nr:potassium channel family protein [Alkalihalobacterium alkalinitrilicum]
MRHATCTGRVFIFMGGGENLKYKNKFTSIYELLMFFAALISVTFIWTDTMSWLNHLVWLIFFIDVSVRIIRSKNKLTYIKKNPFDIIAIIPLDAIFQLARIVRLYRVVRFGIIVKKYARPAFEILKTNGLDKVLIFTSMLIIVCAIPITIVEPSMETYTDGLWWSIVTATTVGYGDISPTTGIGRVIAVLLMMFGIGLIGMVTGAIATYFINGEEKKEDPTIEYIKNELNRLDQMDDKEFERLLLLMKSLKNEKSIS